jgi:hypothetical protein
MKRQNPLLPHGLQRVLRELRQSSKLAKWRGQDSKKPGFTREKPAFTESGGAKSGALPANLKHVVDNWGSLTEEDHRRIRAIVDGRLA